MFEITITKTGREIQLKGEEYGAISEYLSEDGEMVLKKFGYTPKIEKEVIVKHTIYSQQMEDEDFNLGRVIAAINGLQAPVQVSK